MLSRSEIAAAKAEMMFVPTERVMNAYHAYVEGRNQIKKIERRIEAEKKIVEEYTRKRGAKNLIDPEDGRKIVSFNDHVERTTYDYKAMEAEFGKDVMDRFKVKSTSSRFSIS